MSVSSAKRQNREYVRGNFTVTVEHHSDASWDSDLKDFKWVRVFANGGMVAFKQGGKLLLGASAGSKPASELIKEARREASEELQRMQKNAEFLLSLSVGGTISSKETPAKERLVKVRVSGEIEVKVPQCKSDAEAARYIDEVMTTNDILNEGCVKTEIVGVTEVESD